MLVRLLYASRATDEVFSMSARAVLALLEELTSTGAIATHDGA